MRGADHHALAEGGAARGQQVDGLIVLAQRAVELIGLLLGLANDPERALLGGAEVIDQSADLLGLRGAGLDTEHLRHLAMALDRDQLRVRQDALGELGDLPGRAVADLSRGLWMRTTDG